MLEKKRSASKVVAYRVKEIVAVPVPSLKKLDAVALGLSPGVTIRERSVDGEDCDGDSKDTNSCRLTNGWGLLKAEDVKSVAYEVVHLAEGHDGKVKRREIMV